MPRRISPSPQNLIALAALAKLNAGRSFVEVSSSELGKALGLSQQAASNRLVELEKQGLVERKHAGRSLSVRLTPDGLEAIRGFYGGLKDALEGEAKEFFFHGKVFTGFREGGYYVSRGGYAIQFRKTLGFVPFPGTLNLRLGSPSEVEQRARLGALKGVEIAGFEDKDRSYGPVKCFRAKIAGRYPGAVLAIERTHYDNSVLEVISHLNLRRALKLDDADEVSVTVFL